MMVYVAGFVSFRGSVRVVTDLVASVVTMIAFVRVLLVKKIDAPVRTSKYHTFPRADCFVPPSKVSAVHTLSNKLGAASRSL